MKTSIKDYAFLGVAVGALGLVVMSVVIGIATEVLIVFALAKYIAGKL